MDSNSSSPTWATPQEPVDPDAEYLTIQETAFVFRCSVRTIRRYVNVDGAPHSRLGRRIVFSRADRQALYELRRSGSAPRRVPAQRRRRSAASKSAAPARAAA